MSNNRTREVHEPYLDMLFGCVRNGKSSCWKPYIRKHEKWAENLTGALGRESLAFRLSTVTLCGY